MMVPWNKVDDVNRSTYTQFNEMDKNPGAYYLKQTVYHNHIYVHIQAYIIDIRHKYTTYILAYII